MSGDCGKTRGPFRTIQIKKNKETRAKSGCLLDQAGFMA
jgi:hypothetical protein